MDVYQLSDIRRVAERTHQVMMTLDPGWGWGDPLRSVTIDMVETYLQHAWVSPLRTMNSEEAENYETSLTESGGIACRLEPSSNVHAMNVMNVYVRVGTV